MHIKELVLLVGIIPILCGCPICKPTEVIDIGPIPDSLYTLVPYQNDSAYQFIHSNGYVVDFLAKRYTEDSFTWNECGCSPNYKQYRNTTNLVSTYPSINIQLNIEKYDSIHSFFTIVAQNSSFGYLPVDTFFTASNRDSILINNTYYKDVFVLQNDDTYNASIIFADSIYYNKQNGLLKLFMHNGENYAIYP